MLSILDREPFDRVVNIDAGRAVDPPSEEPAEESPEFEIVLGRRQIASVLFVATVVLVAFSAISYLAGKSLAPKPAAPAVSIAPPIAIPQREPIPQPQAAAPAPVERPLFGDPKSGALYLQLGAVEKGVAIIMAEGLRKRTLDAFVAPGPNDHVFRVLIGPLDAESYKRTKDAVDEIGLSTFARKYQQ